VTSSSCQKKLDSCSLADTLLCAWVQKRKQAAFLVSRIVAKQLWARERKKKGAEKLFLNH
jgi:hypothetical protein